jgi:hypothetical protein
VLPTNKSTFAVDLNGDGSLDNQYGAVVAALQQQSLDPQGAMDAAIATGQMILLIDFVATDATVTTSVCARSDVARAQSSPMPVFDGGGSFSSDPTAGTSSLVGAFGTSIFHGDIGHPVTAPPTVELAFPSGGSGAPDGGFLAPLEIPVTLVQIQFKRITGGLAAGQVNGFISKADVQSKLVPGMAASFNAKVNADPGSDTSLQLLTLFDTGGSPDAACSGTCKNPSGDCAVAGDKIISTCEFATNTIMRKVFLPDVQMFSANGGTTYDPNAGNTSPDSLSIGLGFSAVVANY